MAGFLALAMAGLTTRDLQALRSSCVAMNLTGWCVTVPICFASFVTGLIQSLGTPWGLFRHYWVVTKLLIAIIATIVLLMHMRPIASLGGAAVDRALGLGDYRDVRVQLVADAGAALLALILATTLSVYKPRGLTKYGWRRQQQNTSAVP